MLTLRDSGWSVKECGISNFIFWSFLERQSAQKMKIRNWRYLLSTVVTKMLLHFGFNRAITMPTVLTRGCSDQQAPKHRWLLRLSARRDDTIDSHAKETDNYMVRSRAKITKYPSFIESATINLSALDRASGETCPYI